MTFPLESQIMEEIGFDSHFNWYNGSGSCEYIRKEAARKLGPAISEHHKNGEEIAAVIPGLIGIVKEIAQYGDSDRYTLTHTWQAASDVISTHIKLHGTPVNKRGEYIRDVEKHLRRTYLPRGGNFGFYRPRY